VDIIEDHDESPPHDLVLGSQSDDADVTLTEDRDQSNALSCRHCAYIELMLTVQLFQIVLFTFVPLL
jgi:hypothetical protein